MTIILTKCYWWVTFAGSLLHRFNLSHARSGACTFSSCLALPANGQSWQFSFLIADSVLRVYKLRPSISSSARSPCEAEFCTREHIDRNDLSESLKPRTHRLTTAEYHTHAGICNGISSCFAGSHHLTLTMYVPLSQLARISIFAERKNFATTFRPLSYQGRVLSLEAAMIVDINAVL